MSNNIFGRGDPHDCGPAMTDQSQITRLNMAILNALAAGRDLQGKIDFGDLQNFIGSLDDGQLMGPYSADLYTSLDTLRTPGQDLGNTLTNGVLRAGDYLQSDSGQFTAVFQEDGNFVVYDNTTGEATWSSDTHFNAIGGTLAMQSDGNLVVYDAAGGAEWDSSTYSRDGTVTGDFTLAMQDDGNLVVYDSAGQALWSSMHGKLAEASAITPPADPPSPGTPPADPAPPSEGINDPAPQDGGTATPVDRSAAEDLADRANQLYYQVMDMNMDFQEGTAGGKVAKDQSGKVSA